MIDPLRAKGAPAELAVGVTPSPRPHSASNACELARQDRGRGKKEERL
jgi:hypothetical protein